MNNVAKMEVWIEGVKCHRNIVGYEHDHPLEEIGPPPIPQLNVNETQYWVMGKTGLECHIMIVRSKL